jgi:hypothetical protein
VLIVVSGSFWVLNTTSGVLAKTLWISYIPGGGLCRISYMEGLPYCRFLGASVSVPHKSRGIALINHFKCSAHNGFLLSIKFARLLAHVIVVARSSVWVARDVSADSIQSPGQNWLLAFHKRHLEIKAVTQKAIEWERYDHNIYNKIVG